MSEILPRREGGCVAESTYNPGPAPLGQLSCPELLHLARGLPTPKAHNPEGPVITEAKFSQKGEDREAQTGERTCPRSPSQLGADFVMKSPK